MAIQFHLDENVSRAVASALRLRGIDVTTATDAALIGAEDRAHIEFASARQRVIVTHDDDCTHIHAASAEHAGICNCHRTSTQLVNLYGCYCL